MWSNIQEGRDGRRYSEIGLQTDLVIYELYDFDHSG